MTDPIQDATLLLERSLDHTRSVGPPASTARALLQLTALRFLSTSGQLSTAEDSWNRVLRPPTATSHLIEVMLASLAASVESTYSELAGIFTEHLLPALRNAESLLQEWMQSLERICAVFAGDAQAFGKWFDAVADSVVGSGAPGWQYATPRDLADLMVRLAKTNPQDTVHDPCSGTGSFLAAAIAHCSGGAAGVSLSGQEIDPGIAALARLRLFLLGARNVQIKVGDVLREPRFVEADPAPRLPSHWGFLDKKLSTFDVVLCDPPYGQRLANIDFVQQDSYHRFRHGKPGRTSSEMAFVQHAIACLKPGGRAIALIAHGPLFRGGGDGEIRTNLIRDDLIEAVIGLPFGLLSGLSVEPALILCRRGKDAIRKGRILFIDASEERDALGNAAAWRDLVSTVLDTVEKGGEQRPFSRLATVAQIEANGFSLQPRRYVGSQDESSSSFDIQTALAQARAYEQAAKLHGERMDRLATELLPLAIAGDRTTRNERSDRILTPYERMQSLTSRERQVLERVVSGRLNKQIAAELGIGVITVKVHRRRIMLKMGAVSLLDLVALARESGVSSTVERTPTAVPLSDNEIPETRKS